MAYQKALEENEVRRVNFKSIFAWIETNKSRIKAKPGKSVVYAGLKIPTFGDLSPDDRKALEIMPMYKYIKAMALRPAKAEFPGEFEMLGDVLKKMRDYPTLITRDRQKIPFNNASEFFSEIKQHSALLPDVAKVYDECWKRLSQAYVNNAKGDIEILDGVADDYQMLSKETVLLNTELPASLKNHSKLSPAGKAKLLKKISEYGKEFDNRHTKLIRQLDNEVSRLKRPQH